MRLKANLHLRKIGNLYMIVDATSGCVNLTNVFTLNPTAAWLWQQAAGKDFTTEELARLLCDKYEVEPSVAIEDVTRQIADWETFGLLQRSEHDCL